MTRPSAYPRWADVSGAIVEPSSGKKDLGWVPGEKPPAQYMNWLQELAYEWIKYWGDDQVIQVGASTGSPGQTGAAGDWVMADNFKIVKTTVDGSYWVIQVPVHLGWVIKSARLRCKPANATNYLTVNFTVVDSDGSVVEQKSVTSTTGSAWEWVALTLDDATEILAGYSVTVEFHHSGGGSTEVDASQVEVTYQP